LNDVQVACLGEVSFKVAGHIGAVRNLDWANDSMCFQTNTDSHELRFWKISKPERRAWYAEEIRFKQLPENLCWTSWTCPMGWPVLGIQATSDMLPRNNIPLHSAFTYNGDFLVFGDTSRQITLARFPCPSLNRTRKVFSGHCSPIRAVQFINNCSRVATCSEDDSCIIQWKVVQEPERIVMKKEIKEPVIVLHGDVSAKSAKLCAVCHDPSCQDLTHGDSVPAKAIKDSGTGAGGYQGDREEGQEEDGIPQLPWEKSMIGPFGWSEQSKACAPLEDIVLDHVYGYQGSDRKCNAKILRTGEMIFTAGCIVVVNNNYTRRQRHFVQHHSAIVSFAVHPDKSTICSASNGENASIFIWDSITMEVSHNLRHCFVTGFTLVSFAGHEGEKILVVGNDDLQTLSVAEWAAETVLKSTFTQVIICSTFFFLRLMFSTRTTRSLILICHCDFCVQCVF